MNAWLRHLLSCCVTVTCLAAGAACSHAADYEWGWVPVGGGGNLMTVAYHPVVPGVIGLRSDVGGCFLIEPPAKDEWRSLALSASLSRADSSIRGPSGFAFDPQDPKTMYIACQAGLYKTSDNGKTWTRKFDKNMRIKHNTKKTNEPLAVDPLNPNVIYAGSFNDGLYRSTDAGETWQHVAGVPYVPNDGKHTSIPCVIVSPHDGKVNGRSKTIYVASTDRGVFASTDGGASFTQISDTLKKFNTFRVDRNGVFYVSGNGGLLRYEDGTWSDVLLKGAAGFDVDPHNPQRLVAVAGGKVQRSTDRGKTWTILNPEMGEAHGWWKYAWKNPWGGPNTVTLDPHHPGKAIWLTCYQAYHTDNIWGDTTITWDCWYKGVEETVAYEAMTPPGSKYFYTGFGDIMGLRHENLVDYPGGDDATPGHVTPGMDYYPRDTNQIWHTRVGGTKWVGIQVYRSNDAGDTWHETAKPFANNMPMSVVHIAVSATNPDMVVVAACKKAPANVYTTDGGKTWTTCKNLPGNLQGHNPREYWYQGNILASDKVVQRFYAYNYNTGKLGHHGRLWTSTDGENWQVVYDKLPSWNGRQKQVTITTAHNKEGWLVLSANFVDEILVSTDAGKSWKKIEGFSKITSGDFAKERPGASSPALVISGERDGEWGVFHCDNYFDSRTPTWKKISLPEFPLLEPRELRGCKQEYGRVFISEGGRGWVYGRIKR